MINLKNKELTWNQVKGKLKFTPEEEAEIQLEEDLIEATIEARKRNNLSQRELSIKTGIKQPSIARIESRSRSPQASTLIKLLYPMGYTIRVVPLWSTPSVLLKYLHPYRDFHGGSSFLGCFI